MTQIPQSTPQPDPLLQLPHSFYYQAVHELHASLPAPAEDTPEAHAHRINSAIANVASMLPANADEVTLTVRCVSAHAQSIDSLRLARQSPDDAAHVGRCAAQSSTMMRAANSARSLLLRVQAARQRREADPVSCGNAEWVEHCAVGLMVDALHGTAPAPTPPPPEPMPQPPLDPDDRFSTLTEAEQYAVLHPDRAALIRSLGRLPDNCSFGPPPPELVDAIVTATSPILLQLDRPSAPVSPHGH